MPLVSRRLGKEEIRKEPQPECPVLAEKLIGPIDVGLRLRVPNAKRGA